MASPTTADEKYDKSKDTSDLENHGGVLGSGDVGNADHASTMSTSDVLGLQDMDPVLNMKMHLVNNVS
jgi:hypothetical protein